MNLHFPLPKIRNLGDELTLSLAKNSHFSFPPLHFPSLPPRRGHHCGAEIRNEFTLSIAKNFFALFVPPLSKMARAARRVIENPRRMSKWGLCEYVMVHTIWGGSPVILWISLGGKPKWLPLKFGYHDVMRTSPILPGPILFFPSKK